MIDSETVTASATTFPSPAKSAPGPRRPLLSVRQASPTPSASYLDIPGARDDLSLFRSHSGLETHQKPQGQLRAERQGRIDLLRHSIKELLGPAALHSLRRGTAMGTATVALATLILTPISFFAGFPAATSSLIAAGLFFGITLVGLSTQIISRWRHLRKVSPEIRESLTIVAQELEDLSRPGAYEQDAKSRRDAVKRYIETLPATQRYAAQMHLLPQYQSFDRSAETEADAKQHKQVIDLLNALHGGVTWHFAEFFIGISDVGAVLRETIASVQKTWSTRHTRSRRASMGIA